MNEKYKEVILENQSKIGKSFDFYDELENRNPNFYKWNSQTAITYASYITGIIILDRKNQSPNIYYHFSSESII